MVNTNYCMKKCAHPECDITVAVKVDEVKAYCQKHKFHDPVYEGRLSEIYKKGYAAGEKQGYIRGYRECGNFTLKAMEKIKNRV